MALTIFHFNGAGDTQQVTSSDVASFVADRAYVVLCEDSTPSVFVWHGQTATVEAREAAAAHASEMLLRSVFSSEAKVVGSLLQGEETEEFKKLFPAIYAVPAASEDDQQERPEDDPAVEVGTAGQSKKKKRKNKKSRGGGAASTAGFAAVEEKALGSAAEPAAPQAPSAKAPASVPALVDVLAVAEEAVALVEEPVSLKAGAVVVPKETTPTVASTQDSHNAAEEQEPPAAESVTVDDKVATSARPTPAAAPAHAERKGGEPVIEATGASQQKELKPAGVLEHTGGVGYLDPLSGKEAKVKSYLADSAKAWGGGTIPLASSAGAAVPAGSTFFSYEKLKDMRPESGIDMTCKESYLSDEDFVKVLKLDRHTWMAQPTWRRQHQKKAVGLW